MNFCLITGIDHADVLVNLDQVLYFYKSSYESGKTALEFRFAAEGDSRKTITFASETERDEVYNKIVHHCRRF